jgi:ribonuclease HI
MGGWTGAWLLSLSWSAVRSLTADQFYTLGATATMYTLQFDGLFHGFPGYEEPKFKAGFLCYGWIISQDGRLIARGHGAYARGHNATSNIAEYLALIEGLEALFDLGVMEEVVLVTGDAKFVIDQMQGIASVSSQSIKPLFRRAVRLAQHFLNVQWEWTPRRNNRAADSLTRKAMQQIRMDHRRYQGVAQAANAFDRDLHGSWKLLPVLDLRVYEAAKS